MDLQLLFTGFTVFVIAWYLAGRHRQPREPIKFSDPDSCNQILACKGYSNTGAKNLYPGIKSRAIPNQRLVRAFDINNSFTTSDDKRHKEFKLEAQKAIIMTEAKWQDVADFANTLIGQAITPSNPATVGQSTPVPLDSLVRSVCLKVVLHVLFNKHPLEMDDETILTITDSINTLWIQSKGTGVPSEADKNTLRNALEKFSLKMDSEHKHENSLNLIIPSYETLWRVVLSGFLQVTFVRGASPTWTLALENFFKNPTIAARKDLFQDPEGVSVSVDHLVKETLRLYPSVKRVYRRLHMDDKPEPEEVAADVEACQRSQVLWGPDAQRFIPSRWNTASDEAQKFYLAFGASPFVCPAKGEFGPMMIGILVAAFTRHVSSEEWNLKPGEGSPDVVQRGLDKALSGEEPLISDRSTYEGIRIVRK